MNAHQEYPPDGGVSGPDDRGEQAVLRVLIVEDSPEDAETFSRALERDPGRTRRCRRVSLGEEALALLRQETFDCVLLDYGLPDMTGLEWLAEAGSSCAVVVLTGLGDEQVAVAAMKAGAQDYLVKGRLKPRDLQRAVDGATGRWALARQLERANARTVRILESVTDAFVTLDADFRFRYVNPAAETLAGQPAARLLGASVWEVLPWLSTHTAGEQLRAAQHGRQAMTFEMGLNRSGAWYGVRIYPTDGGGLTVYISDLSEHRRLELDRLRLSGRLERLYRAGLALNAVQERTEIFATLAEHARQIFGAVAGTFALCSAQAPVLEVTGTFGLGADELRGWPQLPLAAPFPLCDAVRSRDLVLLRSHEEASIWYPRLFDSGAEQGHAAWAAIPIVLGDSLLGSLGLIYDMPQPFGADDKTLLLAFGDLCAQTLSRVRLLEQERELRQSLERRVEERTAELRRSNSELEQFATVASHDLREPLRTISSYTQLLAGRYGPQLDERGGRYLGFILESTTRMHRMIEDLLELSRVGTHGSVYSLTDTGALVDATLALLGTAIEESGATVTRGELPRVQADATQLTQLFQNLIANAVKFRRAGVAPQIRLSAARDGAFWRFAVTDNGIGIAPEYGERVFGLFQRLHRRDEYAGNGIGLSVCQKIVTRHGGRLWLDSVPGQGSTFLFTLPAMPPRGHS